MPTAGDVMTPDPVTIRDTRTVGEASRILDQLAIRHLPVIDAEGEVVGMISDRDLRGALSAADEDFAPSVPPPSTRVVDVMTTDVIIADTEDELIAIAQLMIDARVGAVPIVDRDDHLVGIVSYIDILRAFTGVADARREAPLPKVARHR